MTYTTKPCRLQSPLTSLLDIPLGNRLNLLEKWASQDSWRPPLELRDDGQNYIVELEAGGMKKEDFTITVHQKELTIRGKKGKNETSKILLTEKPYGEFQRSLQLNHPILTENIQAHYQNGSLTIILPKSPEAQPRKIDILNQPT
jgi:HSP20 family protein